ncbi:hypothetical protein K458DRAFT_373277 [Lentithecium fluviatile CBS 122367]|uniref:AAA+ ATPase domain-containing protein n=1 Tax=Lentithecium fluviatile CBS 122367 TaxID=1168545 RepID=A0A6G1IQC5_9PLEO|nr:hypothetical protein K458DRAFT_373277 [Lentithecium fluviatile CBS 122367]
MSVANNSCHIVPKEDDSTCTAQRAIDDSVLDNLDTENAADSDVMRDEPDADPPPRTVSETPARLVAAIEKLIMSDEFKDRRAEAERFYLDALERTTVRLNKLARRRSFSDIDSAPSSDLSSPNESDTDDSDDELLGPSAEHVTISHTNEVQYRRQFWNAAQNKTTELTAEAPLPVHRNVHLEENHAFTWRLIESRHGVRLNEAIIHCPNLRKLLATELRDYPSGHWDLPRMRFVGDFLPLVRNWKRLREAAAESASRGDSCGMHLRRLLDLVKQTKNVQLWLRHLDHGLKTIRYDHLCYLFVPGELVFATTANQPCAFRVHDSAYAIGLFHIFCWGYDFDGTAFNREPVRITIERFPGAKQIQMLRCYPLRCHDDKSIRTTLLNRGRKFRDYSIREKEQRLFSYKGSIYHCSQRPEDVFGEEYAGLAMQAEMIASIMDRSRRRATLGSRDDLDELIGMTTGARVISHHGEVIVDAEGYESYGPQWPRRRQPLHRPDFWKECDCAKCQKNTELQELLKVKYDGVKKLGSGDWPNFEDDQLMICPPIVAGYALTKKLWVYMEVNNLMPAEASPECQFTAFEKPFDRVILPNDDDWKETKNLIRTLITNHTPASPRKEHGIPAPLRDVIEGKGQGLVILLYGETGVGKTLMAETVASYTGKPLLKVSVADIGLTITTVEKKLEELFDVATRWNAVLLFDEADVLLEQRTDQAALKRNSMVSVFLKVLEYYEGILLLTTNRLLTFDTAVQSRVHLAVEFPKMSRSVQKGVIEMFLEQIAAEDMDERDIRTWISKLHVIEFNGREIRNILSAAVNRARAARRKLLREDIEVFWNRAGDFKRQLAQHNSVVGGRQLAPGPIH